MLSLSRIQLVLGGQFVRCVLQNYEAEDVLGLSAEQVVTVVRYMLSEARGTSLLDEAVRLIGQRMDVLRTCCRGNHTLVNAVIDFLVEQIAQKQ